MTWDAHHRRRDIVRQISDRADARPDGHDHLDEIAGAREVYPDHGELLIDLQLAWFQTLSGQLDRQVEHGVADPEGSVCAAWAAAADLKPGLRAILDTQRENPALSRAFDREAAALGWALGFPMGSAGAREAGLRVRERARAEQRPPVSVPDTPAGLFARIREVFAA